MSSQAIVLRDGPRILRFGFDDMLRYHGGGSPGGVAHAFKVLERGLPLLGGGEPLQRRELTIATAFGGPGARDGFELVTRAVTGGRFHLLEELARHDLGDARERFVFRLGYRAHTVTLTLRDGFVTPAFLELSRRDERNPEDEVRFTALKAEMAERVMAVGADQVYDVQTP